MPDWSARLGRLHRPDGHAATDRRGGRRSLRRPRLPRDHDPGHRDRRRTVPRRAVRALPEQGGRARAGEPAGSRGGSETRAGRPRLGRAGHERAAAAGLRRDVHLLARPAPQGGPGRAVRAGCALRRGPRRGGPDAPVDRVAGGGRGPSRSGRPRARGGQPARRDPRRPVAVHRRGPVVRPRRAGVAGRRRRAVRQAGPADARRRGCRRRPAGHDDDGGR